MKNCLSSLQCTGKLFAAFRGIRDTKIEKSRGIQDKINKLSTIYWTAWGELFFVSL